MNPQTPKQQLYVPGTKILDSRFRELEPEVDALGFAQLCVRKIDEESRTFEAVVSTGDIDRYGEMVDPKGFNRETIKAFMANPVLLAGHRHIGWNGEPTIIGHWLSIKREGNEIIAVGKMATTALAETYWQLLKGGSLRAFSIGFMVREWEMREVGQGDDKHSVRVFTKIELLEISAVAVPANRGALLKAAGFGDLFKRSGDDAEGEAPAGGEEAYRKLASLIVEQLDISGAVRDAIKEQLNGDPDGPMARLFAEVLEAAGCEGLSRDYFDDDDLGDNATPTKGADKVSAGGAAAFFPTKTKD